MQICMARGDIYALPFEVLIDGNKTTEQMDNIYFTVKKHYYDKVPIFQKKLSDGSIDTDGEGNYVVTIQPEDTDTMDFGTYDFDIEIVKLPEIKRTFVGKMELMPEVTYRTNEEE